MSSEPIQPENDRRPIPDLDRETRLIRRVALAAFLINIGLTIVKAMLSHYSGSLAVRAAVIDSAADAVASLAVYSGLRLSAKKSPSFPYGLYKIENIISVVIALFIFFAGYEIIREVFSPPSSAPMITFPVIVWLVVGMLVTLLFGQYAVVIGKRTESPAIIAEGRHRQVDVLSSAVVVLAVIFEYIGFEFHVLTLSGDQIAAALVVLFIGYAGWELLSDGMRVLLDASLDSATLDTIRSIIEAEPLVDQIQWLSGRNSGRFRFLECRLAFRTDDLKKADQVRRQIEARIRRQVPRVEGVWIHFESVVREWTRTAVPLSDPFGTISPHFGEAPYFALVDIRTSDNSVKAHKTLANPHTAIPKGKGIRVAEWLVDLKVDNVLITEDLQGKGPSYVFADAGVTVRQTAFGHIKSVLKNIAGKTDASYDSDEVIRKQ